MTMRANPDPPEPVQVLDDAALDTATEPEFIPQYRILSYGADYDVAGLVNRMETGDIEVPRFQRGFVWDFRRAARFVESLLLGLPVPGIFLWRNPDTQKLVVIDGQQRLRTLQGFYAGQLLKRIFAIPRKLSRYQGVHPRFIGKTYRHLDPEDKRRLDNSIIHATIVSQERPPEDYSSIFYLFERLNTEATPLQPQEIRTAIYQGSFIRLLEDLNSLPAWRAVYGRVSPRMKDRELILRFFAFFYTADDYSRPMKEFLNRYVLSNRQLELHDRDQLSSLFSNTIALVSDTLGSAAFRPANALNAAVYDAVMVGIATRLQRGPLTEPEALPSAYHDLIRDPTFTAAYSRSTADEENVRTRLTLATNAFADLP